MESLLLRSAQIIDPRSAHNGTTTDVLIRGGKILEIGQNLSADGVQEVHSNHLCVSPGWLDLQANFNDPGFEHRETLESGRLAAARGGYTAVAVMPSTDPVIDSKSSVEYILNRSATGPVELLPIGALSEGRKGLDIAGMYDMHMAGAVAFSDDQKPVSNAGLLLLALQYVKPFDGLVVHFPHDVSIAGDGKMNESPMSTQLGMKGIPALAEELMVERDLSLVNYAGAQLHFGTISTQGSVQRIREAQQKGARISAGVTPYHLVLTDEVLKDFDTNYKVLPPLRREDDREALLAGVVDGTIQVICTDHRPREIETKQCEFDHAAFGMIGLESTYALLNTHLRDRIPAERLVEMLSLNPRQLVKQPVEVIEEGSVANLTLFDPSLDWVYAQSDQASLATNSPFYGAVFTGKVIGVFNRGMFFAS
ncbi:MAG: dihydroorotase [Salibacteraceae bacterium]